RPRFFPEKEDALESCSSTIFIDPEASDSSEQQFMASLDASCPPVSRSRFVLDEDDKQEPADLLEKANLANAAEDEVRDLALTSREPLSNWVANSLIPQDAPTVSAQEVVNPRTDHALAFAAPDRALASDLLTSEADSFW